MRRFAAQVAGFDISDLNFILILRAEQNYVINPRSGQRSAPPSTGRVDKYCSATGTGKVSHMTFLTQILTLTFDFSNEITVTRDSDF